MPAQEFPLNEIKYSHTGHYFQPLRGERSDQWGEAVHFMHSWGGVILEFKDGVKITFSLSDLEYDGDTSGPGEDAIRTWDGGWQVF